MFLVIAALTIAPPPAMSHDEYLQAITDVRDRVARLAFTPGGYFADERYGRDDLAVVYREGAQFGWPVYAIAVRVRCLGSQAGPSCGFRARMARLPRVPGEGWPRQRALPWIRRFTAAPKSSPDEVTEALRSGGLEWVETDASACPKAALVFKQLPDLRFAPPEFRKSARLGVPAPPLLHADGIELTLQGVNGKSVYAGAIEPGSVAEWATGFTAALEPCWRPAVAAPPWGRPR